MLIEEKRLVDEEACLLIFFGTCFCWHIDIYPSVLIFFRFHVVSQAFNGNGDHLENARSFFGVPHLP